MIKFNTYDINDEKNNSQPNSQSTSNNNNNISDDMDISDDDMPIIDNNNTINILTDDTDNNNIISPPIYIKIPNISHEIHLQRKSTIIFNKHEAKSASLTISSTDTKISSDQLTRYDDGKRI
jgi:hypothetical protein